MELQINRALRVVVEQTLPRQCVERLAAQQRTINELRERFGYYAAARGDAVCGACNDVADWVGRCRCGAPICDECGRKSRCPCDWLCARCAQHSQCRLGCTRCREHDQTALCALCGSRNCEAHLGDCQLCDAVVCAKCARYCACGQICTACRRDPLGACADCRDACTRCVGRAWPRCDHCQRQRCTRHAVTAVCGCGRRICDQCTLCPWYRSQRLLQGLGVGLSLIGGLVLALRVGVPDLVTLITTLPLAS